MDKMNVDISIKDTSLFKDLCIITAYLISESSPEVASKARELMVVAGIIKDPKESVG